MEASPCIRFYNSAAFKYSWTLIAITEKFAKISSVFIFTYSAHNVIDCKCSRGPTSCSFSSPDRSTPPRSPSHLPCEFSRITTITYVNRDNFPHSLPIVPLVCSGKFQLRRMFLLSYAELRFSGFLWCLNCRKLLSIQLVLFHLFFILLNVQRSAVWKYFRNAFALKIFIPWRVSTLCSFYAKCRIKKGNVDISLTITNLDEWSVELDLKASLQDLHWIHH